MGHVGQGARIPLIVCLATDDDVKCLKFVILESKASFYPPKKEKDVIFLNYLVYLVFAHLFLDKHLLWLKRYTLLNTLQISDSLIAFSLCALFAKLLTTTPDARGLCLAGEQNQLFIIPLILLISYWIVKEQRRTFSRGPDHFIFQHQNKHSFGLCKKFQVHKWRS